MVVLFRYFRTNDTFSDQWVFGPMIPFSDQWVFGQMIPFSDQWVFGPMGFRTNGPSDQWVFGPMGRRTNGFSDQWAVGPSTWHHICMLHKYNNNNCTFVYTVYSDIVFECTSSYPLLIDNVFHRGHVEAMKSSV